MLKVAVSPRMVSETFWQTRVWMEWHPKASRRNPTEDGRDVSGEILRQTLRENSKIHSGI